MTQNCIDLECKHTKTQWVVQKIVANLEDLTKQFSSYKLASNGELGMLKGEITSEVTNRLFVTKQKVTQLSGELENQSKSVADNSKLLRDLMVGIGDLGENMKKIN